MSLNIGKQRCTHTRGKFAIIGLILLSLLACSTDDPQPARAASKAEVDDLRARIEKLEAELEDLRPPDRIITVVPAVAVRPAPSAPERPAPFDESGLSPESPFANPSVTFDHDLLRIESVKGEITARKGDWWDVTTAVRIFNGTGEDVTVTLRVTCVDAEGKPIYMIGHGRKIRVPNGVHIINEMSTFSGTDKYRVKRVVAEIAGANRVEDEIESDGIAIAAPRRAN